MALTTHTTRLRQVKWAVALRRGSAIVSALLLIGMLLASCTSPILGNDSGSSGVLKTGRQAPDFALPGLNGQTIRLSDYRGQVVLVNFWATWCPPCKAEMPELEAVYQGHRDDGFVIIGVDQGESSEVVRAYIEDGGFSWIFALDQTGEASSRYGVTGIPHSYLVDREGKIRYIWYGALTREELLTQLHELGIA